MQVNEKSSFLNPLDRNIIPNLAISLIERMRFGMNIQVSKIGIRYIIGSNQINHKNKNKL